MSSEKQYTNVLWKRLFGENSERPKNWISHGRNQEMPRPTPTNEQHHPDFAPLTILSNEDNLERIQVNEKLFLSRDDHDRLLLHCRTHLDNFRMIARNRHIARMERAWRAFQAEATEGLNHDESAQMKSATSALRLEDYLELPFVFQKLEDLAAIIGNIIFPPTGMYAAVSNKQKMALARSFSDEMNKHARRFAHYPEAMNALRNMLRYNVAAIQVSWDTIYGQVKVGKSPNDRLQFKRGAIYSGNRLKSIDPFNLYYDPSVSKLSELGTNGEFVAYAQRDSLFRVKARIEAKEYFGSTEFEDENCDVEHSGVLVSNYPGFYYRSPPVAVEHWEKNNHNQQYGEHELRGHVGRDTDWAEVAMAGSAGMAIAGATGGLAVRGQVEIVHMYVRLDADDYGLMKDNDDGQPEGQEQEEGITVWHIVILNGRRILLAEPDTSPHGLLPIQVAALGQDDNSDMHEKAIADYLVPFQQHMSDLLAKLQMGIKKGLLGGITLYDAKHVKLDSSKNPLGSFVPVENLPPDGDIRRYIAQFSETPDTSRSMQQIKDLLQIMEQVIPTNQGQQVADLQRATEFQAAATVAASNKRSLVLAKVADDLMFNPIRRMQLYNIMGNQSTLDVPDETGTPQAIPMENFYDAGLEFDISSGLIGIDRLIMSNRLWQLITAVIQSNMAQTTDMFALLDYYMTLLGDPTDFRAFKLQSPFDNMTPEQKQMAVQALQAVSQGQAGQAPALAQPSTPPLKP